MTCELCQKIKTKKYLIQEFEHSYWVLGDHQFFKGYSQIIYKDHVRDLLDLSEEINLKLYSEVHAALKASQKFLKPWKMNLSCYGNAVPHIHWHLFPRYESEMDVKKVPWFYMEQFNTIPTDKTDFQSMIENLKNSL